VPVEQLVWDRRVSHDRARVAWARGGSLEPSARAAVGHHVRYIKAPKLVLEAAKLVVALHQLRADNSFER